MVKRLERKERIPVSGMKDILTVKDKDPNYEYRWVLDLPGRLDKFEAGGWEVVKEDLEVGQKAVDTLTRLGTAITKAGGGGRMLVLMRIQRDWYTEDQMAKQDKVDALESTMQEDLRRGGFPGAGGGSGSYVPDGGGLKITRK